MCARTRVRLSTRQGKRGRRRTNAKVQISARPLSLLRIHNIYPYRACVCVCVCVQRHEVYVHVCNDDDEGRANVKNRCEVFP